MRDRHASKESSAEPEAMRSMFLLDIVGELLEDLAAVEVDVELMDGPVTDFISVDGLDELMDESDEDFISSLAQPTVSRAVTATMPAILAIRGLIRRSSVLRMDNELRAKRPYCNLLDASSQGTRKETGA
jgi:hypothetical protein